MLGLYWLVFTAVLIILPSKSFQAKSGIASSNLSANQTTADIREFEISYTNSCDNVKPQLSEIPDNISNSTHHILVRINVENLKLSRTAKFSNLRSVTIYGKNSTITCSNNSGISFQLVEKVTLCNITIMACGIWKRNHTSGVRIAHCSHIVLLNITLKHSNGSGVYIDSPKNQVSITDSYFISNKLPDSVEKTLVGGNGMTIKLDDRGINDATNLTVSLERCVFADNIDSGESFTFLYGNLSGRGRGGGLFIRVEDFPTKMAVIITDCKFEGNTAHLGAGLSVSLRGDRLTKYTIVIKDSIFSRNGCGNLSSLGAGGGAFISFENSKLTKGTDSQFYWVNTTFMENCATLGGGTFFFSNKYVTDQTGTVLFEQCTWSRNRAHIGSAVLLTPNVFVRASIGHLPTPIFILCTFKENSVNIKFKTGASSNLIQYGSGTLHSSLFSIEFVGNASFIDNFGSGLVVVNAEVNFINSSALFFNNTAVQGGALSLIGVSVMTIGSNMTYTFENNRAYDRGGAIFVQLVDGADIVTSRSCFIQYEDQYKDPIHSRLWNSSLVFRNNVAESGGHSIFTTSLAPCQVVITDTGEYVRLEMSEIFTEPGIVIENKEKEKQIATEGSRFVDVADPLNISPGIMTNLNLTIQDDLGQSIDMKLLGVLPKNSSLEVTSLFSNGLQQNVKLNGQEGDKDMLTLQTLGTIHLSHQVEVHLQRCSPGFILSDNTCICKFDSYVGIAKCEDNVAYLIEGFWAGYVNTSDGGMVLTTSTCPQGFCTYQENSVSNRTVRLPRNPDELEKAICGESRKGILCGTCNKGYTVYYHSPALSCLKDEPLSCKLGWLLYIVSEIIPVTLLFGFVLAFNLNFTSGSLNGFILFSQLQRTLYFDASGLITFGPTTKKLTQVYQVIYGIFNLDFFSIEPLSYCLWKNASVLAILCFKYLIIVYSFFLVLHVILFMKYCAARCLGRFYSISVLKNSVIHGISGFLTLCYTQTITISFNLLYSYKLSLPTFVNKTSLENSITRVWFSGNYESFGTGHLPYAVPALVVILTVGCVPPILLLCYPQINKTLTHFKLNKVWGLRKLEHLHTFKPLFDSFQGSFKDKYRFFAGLYFFYRWTGVLIYTYSSTQIGFYMTVQLLLLLMLTTHSICQPYEKWWHNLLDTLIFTNLLIVNGFSILNYFLVRVDFGRNNNTIVAAGFQLFFIYLPLFYLLLNIIVWLYTKVLYPRIRGKKLYEKELASTQKEFSSFRSSDVTDLDLEDNDLPYRLLGQKEDISFTESIHNTDTIKVDTY